MLCNKPFTVVPARKAAKYDGTNSARLAELIADFTVDTETATELTFTSGGTQRTVARDGYVDYTGGVVTAVYQNADDLHDAVTAVSEADHVHEVVLTSGGARPAPEHG